MKRRFAKSCRYRSAIVGLLLLVVGILGSLLIDIDDYANWNLKLKNIPETINNVLDYFEIKTSRIKEIPEGNLTVFELDVGQGKSILAKSGDHAMLIDAGDVEYGNLVANFMQKKKISQLDYLIITHPHADHIGGAREVLRAVSVDKVFMPRIKDELVHTSSSYEKFLDELGHQNLKIQSPNRGDIFRLGAATFQILSCFNEDYDNLNDTSIVTKISYGEFAFLSTGDVEKMAEDILLKDVKNLKCDVLDVSHHGSKTSTTSAFLKAAAPVVALISVGENDYGHPNSVVVGRLIKNGAKCFSTKEEGNLQVNFFENYFSVMNSQGKELFKSGKR